MGFFDWLVGGPTKEDIRKLKNDIEKLHHLAEQKIVRIESLETENRKSNAAYIKVFNDKCELSKKNESLVEENKKLQNVANALDDNFSSAEKVAAKWKMRVYRARDVLREGLDSATFKGQQRYIAVQALDRLDGKSNSFTSKKERKHRR